MPRSHKSLPRLFVEPALASDVTVSLDREQSHYLLNVMRRKAGDQVVLFNGRDGAWLAAITEAGKKGAALSLLEQSAPQTPVNDLWCGLAPIRRQDYLVQKATEMGVGTIQPILTTFVQNHRVAMDKWRAYTIEAAEQCEVLAVPALSAPIGLDALLAAWPAEHGDRILVFADESAASSSPVATLAGLSGQRLGLLIGPEGGFSDAERATLLRSPFVRPISLGPRILRADTAAVAGLALIQALAGDWV